MSLWGDREGDVSAVAISKGSMCAAKRRCHCVGLGEHAKRGLEHRRHSIRGKAKEPLNSALGSHSDC